MTRLGAADLATVDTLITAGIAASRVGADNLIHVMRPGDIR